VSAPLPPGKVPARLVAELLEGRRRPRGEVVGPGPGRDGAVLRIGGEGEGDAGGRAGGHAGTGSFLVAASDPITFAAEEVGWYAVHVNANDVACMGADPAWFLATLLLPVGTSPRDVEEIFAQIREACEAVGAGLVGGHTEVTPGIDRPLVAGTMLGRTDRWVGAEGAEPGDVLVLTKGIAVEGTAILAAAAAERLGDRISPGLLERARGLLRKPGISVVADARTALRAAEVHALHDPTEGGLATGVRELCETSGTGAVLERDRIPVLEETRAVAGALGLDPLGLLASGALLISVPEGETDRLVGALGEEAIPATPIGRVLEAREGVVEVDRSGRRRPLSRFEADELTRAL